MYIFVYVVLQRNLNTAMPVKLKQVQSLKGEEIIKFFGKSIYLPFMHGAYDDFLLTSSIVGFS